MCRKIAFAAVVLIFAFGQASCGAQEGNLKKAQSYDVQTPAGQTGLLNGKDAVAKAHAATAIVRRFGGPFQDVTFFSAKGELLNKNNTALADALVSRDGLAIPFGLQHRQLQGIISPVSWTLEFDQWPNHDQISIPRVIQREGATIGFGVEIDVGKLLKRIKR